MAAHALGAASRGDQSVVHDKASSLWAFKMRTGRSRSFSRWSARASSSDRGGPAGCMSFNRSTHGMPNSRT